MARSTAIAASDDRQQEQLGEVLSFMRALWAVDHGLRSVSKQMEKEIGLTGPQRLAVRIIGRFPGVTAGGLASLLHIHPSTLTGILARLESRQLVRRRSDPADARRAFLDLTPRGRAIDLKRSGTVEARITRALRGLSASQVAAARFVLDSLAGELDTEE